MKAIVFAATAALALTLAPPTRAANIVIAFHQDDQRRLAAICEAAGSLVKFKIVNEDGLFIACKAVELTFVHAAGMAQSTVTMHDGDQHMLLDVCSAVKLAVKMSPADMTAAEQACANFEARIKAAREKAR
jgi:hypothetical protein